ncbi:hypothetical protein CC86DRAFT_379223 [Ophiobolus disseminans]|uniref:Uncharacterized protein n=1 Tax=Ophiobolus disseminans TaxID=1469910 RepID=A0A6A7AAB5_9PLEO|nr:hypothetical protein CC86DRAFT_379223 [Ophiobolus disseminans]
MQKDLQEAKVAPTSQAETIPNSPVPDAREPISKAQRTHAAKHAHARLGGYIDDLEEELNRTKEQLQAEVHDLTNAVEKLEKRKEEQADEIVVLKRKLNEAETSNRKNEETENKLVKLYSHWAGMFEVFDQVVKR